MKILEIEPLEARIAPATLAIGDAQIPEGDSGVTTLNFTVTLDAPATETVTVNYATANQTATDSDYFEASGPLTFAVGETSQTISVFIRGDTVREQDQTFLVNLSGALGATIGDGQAIGTIQTEAGELPAFSVSDPVPVNEGALNATPSVEFKITVTGEYSAPLTVTFATANGTATSTGTTADYTPRIAGTAATTLTFTLGGNTTQSAFVALRGDNTSENDETFFLNLSNPTGGAMITKAQGTGVIKNDDGLGFTVTSHDLPEGNSGTQDMVFTVTMTGEITTDTIINYTTVDNTAKSGDGDFALTQGQLTFSPGQTKTHTITVPINGDTLQEQTEQFFVRLTNAQDAEVAQGTGRITTDELPTLSIDDPQVVEGTNNDMFLEYTVTLTGQAAGDVVVSYATANGTAFAASDYTITGDTLTFAPGELTKKFLVPIIKDATPEENETVLVNLTNQTTGGATLAKGQGIGTILNDEPVSFLIDNAQILEGDAGTKDLSFTVTLVGEISADATVNYQTSNDTATVGEDYADTAGLLTFTPGGLKTRTILVPIFGDSVVEQHERFFVNLSNPTGGVVLFPTDAKGTGTIQSEELPTLSIDDPQIVEGTGGTKQLVFTVSLTGPIKDDATVQFTTKNGTALAGSDFTTQSGTVTFTAADPNPKTIAIAITTDATAEDAESFIVELSNPAGAAISKAEGTGTITNDDGGGFTIGTAQVVEGNSGTSDLVFTVTLIGDLAANATVNYATADGTARVAGNDYALTTGTLTFIPGGDRTQTITVPVTGDTNLEQDETVLVNLSGAAGASILQAQGTGTITSDELPTISIADSTLREGKAGTSQMLFTATLTGELTTNATVNFTTKDGTASESFVNNDYEIATGTLTFVPGESQVRTIAVTINGDGSVEPDETFTVELSQPASAAIDDGIATGTIFFDERTLTVDDAADVIEGDTGNVSAVFAVTLASPAPFDVVVTYRTVDSTASSAGADKDFVPVTNGTVTIPAGQTQTTIVIPVIGDVRMEGAATEGKEEFRLTFSTDEANISDTSADATIIDDDPKLSISDLTLVEGDAGTQTAIFTVLMSGAHTREVTVKYKTEDGASDTGARDGVGVEDGAIAADYVPVADGTLVFNAGQTSRTIEITVNNDTVHELQENFFHLKLLSATAADDDADDTNNPQVAIAKDTGTATIIDNGDAAPTLSIGDIAVAEDGGTADFTITLSHKSDLPVTVDFTTLDGTALAGSDFTNAAGTRTFDPGVTTQTVAVTLTPDATVEADETFSVKLSNAKIGLAGAEQPQTIADDTATGTIRNDEVTVSIENATLSEDGGSMQFNVTLSQPAAADVVVRYSTTNGTAQAPGDFTAAVDQQITILQGATTGIISIPIINEADEEKDETFTVTLDATNAVPATTGATATGTITNDDAAMLSIDDVTVTEGDSGTSEAKFTVKLSGASYQTITVDYKTEDGAAGDDGAKDGVDDILAQDYEAITSTDGVFPTLTFAPGELEKTITVNILGDTIHEALENLFSVKLFNARGDKGDADPANDAPITISDDTGTGTISDAGDALPVISIGDVVVAENGGPAIFTVSLSSGTDLPVTVAFTTANNGALAGTDYTAASGVLTFDPNNPDEAARTSLQVPVAILNDSDKETDELFFLNLSNPTNATFVDGQAVGRIQNDDATFRIVAFDDPGTSATTVAEDGASVAKFKVILEGATPGATTTVQYGTFAGTAVSTGARPDFTAKSGTLVFSGATTEQIIEVPITADAHYENDEQFTIRLSQAVNAIVATGAGTGTVTIANNDAKPTLTIEDVTVVEGNVTTAGSIDTPVQTTVVFKAKLSAANEVDTNVQVTGTTVAGTAISSGANADFNPLAATQKTFTLGVTEVTFEVTILGDLRDEDDQTFRLNLTGLSSGATFAGGGASLFATGTITDDDAAPFVAIKDVTLGENDTGLADTQFEVTLVNAAGKTVESEKQVTVDYTTADGTAKAGSDFTTTAGTLTFAPGTTKQLLTVPLIDDSLAEDTETFRVDFSNAVNATLSDTSATGTITDNDSSARPVITINDISIVEGDAGTSNAIFNVSLSGLTGQTVTVNFATADGTAKATGPFADYVATSGTLTFDPNDPNPARRLTQTIVVPVIGDLFTEGASEAFTVTLTGAVNSTLGDASGTATILNGSDTKLGLVISDAQTTEGHSGGKTLTFNVALSEPATSNVTVNYATLNGTAIAGGDFTQTSGTLTFLPQRDDPSNNDPSVTLPAESAKTISVTIIGDTAWEATESFFVNLSGASSNVEVVDADPLGAAQATARGYIFNDDVNFIGGNKVQWIDVDGDLVTLTTSKGAFNFSATSPTVQTDDLTLVKKNSAAGTDLGGYELQLLNLANDGAAFAGARISIVATKQPGFPLESNGRVDVGWIKAAEFAGEQVTVTGIDLASVTVDGDLAKITAGDNFSTTALGKLDVFSLGARGTATGADDLESRIIGPVTSVLVKQNIEGFLNVIGEEFGNIGTLKIDGALKGGDADISGTVQASGRINNATVGSIIGGAGDNSGLLIAAAPGRGSIGTVKVLGDIVGGSGESSGKIFAVRIGNVSAGNIIGGAGTESGVILSSTTLGKVTLKGDLRGGSGENSGEIFGRAQIGAVKIEGSIVGGTAEDAGSIVTVGNMTSLMIGGAVIGGSGATTGRVNVGGKLGATTIGENEAGDSIAGGAGADSGSIETGGDLASLAIEGNVRGGTGKGSGAIVVGNTLAKLNIGGSLVGGDVPAVVPGGTAATIETSGYIQAVKLTNALIAGDIVAGKANAGAIFNSGAIRTGQIDSLTVKGSLVGDAGNSVIIAALGGAGGQAIKKLMIEGNATFAEILSGYDINVSATNQRGNGANADASIGSVTINGSAKGLNIVAGGTTGTDGRFGTADDRLISGNDIARTISQIASVVIKGGILANDAPFGVIAQHIVSLKLGPTGATAVALQKGAGNDGAASDTDPDPGVEIAAGANFRAIELPLPA